MRWSVPLTLAAVMFAVPAWAISTKAPRDKKLTVVNGRCKVANPDAWPKEWQWKWPDGKSFDELRKDIKKQMEEMRKELKPHDEPPKS